MSPAGPRFLRPCRPTSAGGWLTSSERPAPSSRAIRAASAARYAAILERHPGFAEAHFRLARLLERQGRVTEAGRHYLAALDHDGLPIRCPAPFRAAYEEVATPAPSRHPDRRTARADRGQPRRTDRRPCDPGHASSDLAGLRRAGRRGPSGARRGARSSAMPGRSTCRSTRPPVPRTSAWTPTDGRTCAIGPASTTSAWRDIAMTRRSGWRSRAAMPRPPGGSGAANRSAILVYPAFPAQSTEPKPGPEESRTAGSAAVPRRDVPPARSIRGPAHSTTCSTCQSCKSTIAPRPRKWTTATN